MWDASASGVRPPGPPSPLLAAIAQAIAGGHFAPHVGGGMTQVGATPGGPVQAVGGTPYAPAPTMPTRATGGVPYQPAPGVPTRATGSVPYEPASLMPAPSALPRRAPFRRPPGPRYGARY